MLSLIICSRTSDIPAPLKTNIKETIGVEYELVVIDNSANQYSIFSAYNEGVRRAKGEFLCFMHEDILYHTKNWGEKVLKYFEDKTIGLLALEGTHFLPDFPLYWSYSPFISTYSLEGGGKEYFNLDFFSINSSIVDVIAVDGFCYFMPKRLFDTVKYDEKNYTGFHLYDMDICMQVLNEGKRVCVCNNILIEHFYNADPNKKGVELFQSNLDKFHTKWEKWFPLFIGMEELKPEVVKQLTEYIKDKQNYIQLSNRTTNSMAYKIGRTIINPIRKIKKLF